jgi:hypothetical protein
LSTGFTFHSLSHVDAALGAAAGSKIGVALVTPRGAAATGGPEIYLEMYRQGHAHFPETETNAIIDCGDDAGIAMRALRCGWRDLVFTGDDDVRQKLQDMSDQFGGTLGRSRPPTIDLITSSDPARTVQQALSSSMPS